MLKKTLLAVSLLAATGAFAADVALYGVIDQEIVYSKVSGGANGNVQLKSGSGLMGNRWGMRGKEELGNGFKVSFDLESGYDADTGTLFSYSGDRSRLFGREASLTLSGPYGDISLGRLGNMMSGNGTYGIWAATTSPFSIGWCENGTQYTEQGYTRLDNSITYQTPSFGGFKALVQYAMCVDAVKGTETGRSSTEDRQLGIGGIYRNKDLRIVGIVEWLNRKASTTAITKDQLLAGLAASYRYGMVKGYASVQYQKNTDKVFFNGLAVTGDSFKTAAKGDQKGIEGYACTLGADIFALGGTIKLAGQYLDSEDKARKGSDFKRYVLGAGYRYDLSKRSSLFAGLDYVKDDLKGAKRVKEDQVTVFAGLNHRF